MHFNWLDLPTPCIAGTRAGGFGHFIAILGQTNAVYVTGDPLVGRRECPGDQIARRHDLTGFFMFIEKR